MKLEEREAAMDAPAGMTPEEFELWKQKEHWRDRLESSAHDLMVQASNDASLDLGDFEKLSRIFYGW